MNDYDLAFYARVLLYLSFLVGCFLMFIFEQEIHAFIDYHFTPEFLGFAIKYVFLVSWFSMLSLGLIILIGLRIKKRYKRKEK